MRILVLDTIHGGDLLAAALGEKGHYCTAVDVYRGQAGPDPGSIRADDFDLLVAPVHLDPAHPLVTLPLPLITHHEAVRWLLRGSELPHPFIEVTGKQGKTTTAYAIAQALDGQGVLHTSAGTFKYPGRELLYRASITPASLIRAVKMAHSLGGWLVAEVSLGVSGAGDLAVVTSDRDYRIAGGKKSAIVTKMASLSGTNMVIAPASLPCPAVHVPDIVTLNGNVCRYSLREVSGLFKNPLLGMEPYRSALPLAATALLLTGGDPQRLFSFSGVPGRMQVSREGGWCIINDSNSGINQETMARAALYGRENGVPGLFVLVTGEEFRAVCEGFAATEAARTIRSIAPDMVVSVGSEEYGKALREALDGSGFNKPLIHSRDLDSGLVTAKSLGTGGTIVAAVKTWR